MSAFSLDTDILVLIILHLSIAILLKIVSFEYTKVLELLLIIVRPVIDKDELFYR